MDGTAGAEILSGCRAGGKYYKRAAALLHVTQPTLSRQLMQLEEELGVKLFRRGRYRIILTDDGVLLRRRAQEIVDLAEKVEREFERRDEITGEIAIGAAESNSMTDLSRRMAAFRRTYPLVRFSLYSATADDIKDRLEKGLLDLGLLSEPVEIGRYAFQRMPSRGSLGRVGAPGSSFGPEGRGDTPGSTAPPPAFRPSGIEHAI